jgi:SAM-dependent methyltransferase
MAEMLQTCPLCESRRVREMFWAKDPHYGISGSHRLAICEECSLGFLNPMYSDDELKALYPADYYAYQEEVKPGPFKACGKKLLGYWQGTRDPEFNSPGKILDIGCGAGTFLRLMRDRGWSVHGVEINADAVRRAHSQGLSAFCGTLPEARFAAESFDYIRASHSFEHMSRPHDTLDEIYRLLKPGGKLLIAVPNYDSLPARVFGQSWYHLCPPVHAFHYSAVTLARILTMHGFKVTRVLFNSHYAGVLGSLQIWLNRETSGKSFEGAAFNSRLLRVLSGWIEKILDVARAGDMIEVTAVKGEERSLKRAA